METEFDINNISPPLENNQTFYQPNEIVCKPENTEYELSFRINEFSDEKHERKFINNVKRLIRSSYEYKEWTDFLVDVKHLVNCVVTGEKLGECKIEFHHHPISLENIVTAVIDKFIANKIPFSTSDITYEILKLHFNMKIGVVPLVTTMHQKFHNGFLHININDVIGDYKFFLNNYPLREEMLEVVRRYESINESVNYGWEKDKR